MHTINITPIIHNIHEVVKNHKLAPGSYKRFPTDTEPNPYGCADAANILYSIGAFPRDPGERAAWVKTLQDMQQIFLRAIDSAVKEISGKLPSKPSIKQKAKAIHDWICTNNSYNNAQTSSHKKDSNPVSFAYQAAHSAYSAIVTGDEYMPVCEGYASAFKVLCDAMGVPCLCVNGSTSFASGHMWNLVQLEDGKWYLVDATSDDVEKSGVEYVHQLFLVGKKKSAAYAYTPKEYMNSGVNPSNGYTEGAAFTVPEMAP